MNCVYHRYYCAIVDSLSLLSVLVHGTLHTSALVWSMHSVQTRLPLILSVLDVDAACGRTYSLFNGAMGLFNHMMSYYTGA
jgi:hypothetical protein